MILSPFPRWAAFLTEALVPAPVLGKAGDRGSTTRDSDPPLSWVRELFGRTTVFKHVRSLPESDRPAFVRGIYESTSDAPHAISYTESLLKDREYVDEIKHLSVTEQVSRISVGIICMRSLASRPPTPPASAACVTSEPLCTLDHGCRDRASGDDGDSDADVPRLVPTATSSTVAAALIGHPRFDAAADLSLSDAPYSNRFAKRGRAWD